jgi:biopolymer transport protein ExbD
MRRPEINVTPLVDVCLVILIIFMVVTPLLRPATDPPETPAPEPLGSEPPRARVTIALGPPVSVTVDEDRTPLGGDALLVLLKALHASAPRREIALEADRRLPYREVRRVVAAIQEAGFPGVGLVARKREPRR